jgi:hypothetical protein
MSYVIATHLGCLLLVRLFVEVREEEVEHNSVHSNPPDEGTRVVAIGEEKLEGVEHNSNKLNLKYTNITFINIGNTCILR